MVNNSNTNTAENQRRVISRLVIRIVSARKNLYASKLKKPVTMRLSEDMVAYLKGMADDAGVPYQSLTNLYLRDCLANNRKVQIKWPQTV